MFTNLLTLVATLMIFAIIGMGPYRVFSPVEWRASPFSFPLIIIYGCSWVIVISCIMLSYRYLFSTAFYAVYISSFALLIGSFGNLKNGILLEKDKFSYLKFKIATLTIVIGVIPLLLLSQNSILNLRLGVDIALYSETADALLNNKSLDNLHGFAADCFFLHFRWGQPIFIAFLHKSLGLISPVITKSYIYNASLYGVIGLVSAFLMYSTSKMNLKWSLIGSVLIILNVNIFVVLTEGQWAHYLSIPLLIIYFNCWFLLRYSKNINLNTLKYILTMALMLSALLIVMSEIVPVIIAISIFYLVMDGFIKSYTCLKNTTLSFIITAMISLLITFEYSFTNFTQNGNLISHIFNLTIKQSGYALPHYSLPFEIFGQSNIYLEWKKWFVEQGLPFRVYDRSKIELIIVLFGSLFILYIWLCEIKRTYRTTGLFWVPFVVITAVSYFYYSFYQSSSYIYTKIFTTFIPFMMVPYMNYFYLKDKLTSKNNINIYNSVICLFTVMSIFSITSYIYGFRKSSQIITASTAENLYYEIIKSIPKAIQSNCAIIFGPRGWSNTTLRLVDRNMDFILSTIVGCTVLDEWSLISIQTALRRENSDMKDLNLYYLIDKTKIKEWTDIKRKNANEVLFENEEWLFVNTNSSVAEYLQMNGSGSVNILRRLIGN